MVLEAGVTDPGYSHPKIVGASRQGRALSWPLFAKDFLYVANFLLNFAGDFFACTAISQVGIADRFSALLFNFAFGFPDAAFDFVFSARFHKNESRGATFLRGLFEDLI